MAVMNFAIEDLEQLIAKAKENGVTRINISPCGEYEAGERIHATVHCFGNNHPDGAGGLFLKAMKPNLLPGQSERFYKREPIFELKPGTRDKWSFE